MHLQHLFDGLVMMMIEIIWCWWYILLVFFNNRKLGSLWNQGLQMVIATSWCCDSPLWWFKCWWKAVSRQVLCYPSSISIVVQWNKKFCEWEYSKEIWIILGYISHSQLCWSWFLSIWWPISMGSFIAQYFFSEIVWVKLHCVSWHNSHNFQWDKHC